MKTAEEKDLWAAVLERAIDDLKDPERRDSAMFWFENQKDNTICSFVWICDLFGIDPSGARAAILK